MGKRFDTFSPCGRYVVTLDEFASPDHIELTTLVNGQQRQHSRTSWLIWPVATLLSFLSARTMLMPVDIVLTGMPSGVGQAEGRLLQPADSITVRITGPGDLTNVVGSGEAAD